MFVLYLILFVVYWIFYDLLVFNRKTYELDLMNWKYFMLIKFELSSK